MSEDNKQGILSPTIKDRAVLYAAYMPFVRHGGLFVPTNKKYELGEQIFILLALMDEPAVAESLVGDACKEARGEFQRAVWAQSSAATKVQRWWRLVLWR